jgi:hypothetical protein
VGRCGSAGGRLGNVKRCEMCIDVLCRNDDNPIALICQNNSRNRNK